MMQATKQKGFSLLTSLIIFAALTVVGLAVMRSGVLSEKQAANIQEKSVTFHGAQSSNNSVIESYTYDQSILSKVVAKGKDVALRTCIDSKGNVTADCTTASSVDGGALLAQTDTVYKECLKAQKCIGNSAGLFGSNTVGCNVFQHDGEGWLETGNDNVAGSGESKSEIEQWSLLVSACS